MIKSVGVSTSIIGHSERRIFFNETDEILTKKVETAIKESIEVIFCVGEELNIRKSKNHFRFVQTQLENSVFLQPKKSWDKIIIAYEPVWSIGTGKIPKIQELIKDKTTRSMGLFGLIKMKLTEGNTSLALKLTERLIKLKPRNLSFNKTFFNLQLTEGDWDGALMSYKNINKIKRIDKETYSKGESILLFQKAKELRSDGKTLDALKMSRQALKKYAGLVPNSIFLSELEVLEGQKKKAETVLLSTWKVIPHPDVAKKFAEIEINESVDDRVERFKKILNIKKSDVETKTLKAELNILSENFPEARRAISDLIETDQANAKVYTLMAAIEKGVGSSDAVVKGWLAKAVTAKRSKRWICSNCESQSEWEPVCKKCGEFATLEWREERYENLGGNDQSEILPLIIGENNYSPDIQVDKVEIDGNKV